MSRTIVTLCSALALCLMLLNGGGQDAKASADTVNADKAKEFTTQVSSAKLKSGGQGEATLTIVAGKGFKWNKEYPAKVTFEGTPKHVTLAKTQLKQFGGDFKTSDKKADIAVKMTGKNAGKETLTAKAKFSVCNDTTCVIREASLNVSVDVTK